MSDQYFTTDEVAVICRVQKETVREWIKSGKLAGKRVGRQYLITKEDLTNYLKEKHD